MTRGTDGFTIYTHKMIVSKDKQRATIKNHGDWSWSIYRLQGEVVDGLGNYQQIGVLPFEIFATLYIDGCPLYFLPIVYITDDKGNLPSTNDPDEKPLAV
jgi:hypothetical protein